MANRTMGPVLQAKMDAAVAAGKIALETMKSANPMIRADFTIDASMVDHVSTLTLGQLEKIVGAPLGKPSKMPGFSFGTPAKECQTGTALRNKGIALNAVIPAAVDVDTAVAAANYARVYAEVYVSVDASMPYATAYAHAYSDHIATALGTVGENGTVCEFCYAYEQDNYRWANTIAAAYRRLLAIESFIRGCNPLFPYALARLIILRSATFKHENGAIGTDVFRVHDAGDLQSVAYLQTIAMVCKLAPSIRFWIPTREMRYLTAYHKMGLKFPDNLQVIFSVHKRNAPPTNIAGYRAMGLNIGFSFVQSDHDATRYAGIGAHFCPSLQQDRKCMDCRACWGPRPENRPGAQQPIIVYGFH